MINGDAAPTPSIRLSRLQPDARRAARVRARAAAAFTRGHPRPPRPRTPPLLRQILPPVVVVVSAVCLAELLDTALRTLAAAP